jgi:hypothetical protein
VLPDRAAKSLREAVAVAEYEAGGRIEGLCAEDADRVECLMQPLSVGRAGYTRGDG